MRPILIDTNAYSAFKRGDSVLIQIIQTAEIIGISPIVLGELLSGFDTGNKTKQNRIELQEFLNSSRVKVYFITSDTSYYYSKIHSSLKQKGKPVPTNDMWIAAQALEHGCLMCTFDKHFQYIDGILIANSLEFLSL